LSRLATSFVLAYHGCDQKVAERVVAGETSLLQSRRAFDWLGPGAYFWESDPRRAFEWAQWKASTGAYSDPTVIGAVIDLQNCLDLVSRPDLELVKAAHRSFVKTQKAAGLPIPKNGSPKGRKDRDRVLRYLDCAVINHLHQIIQEEVDNGGDVDPFDTVRGMFTEGDKLYPGCGFYERSHVQIAVLNDYCIKGIFWAREISN
jgi:hypothetical protein